MKIQILVFPLGWSWHFHDWSVWCGFLLCLPCCWEGGCHHQTQWWWAVRLGVLCRRFIHSQGWQRYVSWHCYRINAIEMAAFYIRRWPITKMRIWNCYTFAVKMKVFVRIQNNHWWNVTTIYSNTIELNFEALEYFLRCYTSSPLHLEAKILLHHYSNLISWADSGCFVLMDYYLCKHLPRF